MKLLIQKTNFAGDKFDAYRGSKTVEGSKKTVYWIRKNGSPLKFVDSVKEVNTFFAAPSFEYTQEPTKEEPAVAPKEEAVAPKETPKPKKATSKPADDTVTKFKKDFITEFDLLVGTLLETKKLQKSLQFTSVSDTTVKVRFTVARLRVAPKQYKYTTCLEIRDYDSPECKSYTSIFKTFLEEDNLPSPKSLAAEAFTVIGEKGVGAPILPVNR